MDNQKLSERLSALAEKIDAFLESYLREGELFGPPVWLIPPPWYAFKYRKIDRETNRRLHAHGLPEMTMDFRLRFNTQAGQGLEDCGGYLRRKWFVALGVDHAEYDEWAYSPHHPASPESEGLMTEKLSERVERLEGPDREVDREIADALGLGPDETWERPVSRKGVASMNTGDWIKGNLLRRSKHYTASLDAAMSLLNEHGCDLHIRPSATTVRCFPNEDEGVKATAKTPAIALCAAALKARGL